MQSSLLLVAKSIMIAFLSSPFLPLHKPGAEAQHPHRKSRSRSRAIFALSLRPDQVPQQTVSSSAAQSEFQLQTVNLFVISRPRVSDPSTICVDGTYYQEERLKPGESSQLHRFPPGLWSCQERLEGARKKRCSLSDARQTAPGGGLIQVRQSLELVLMPPTTSVGPSLSWVQTVIAA